jgi:hypothetical protein
MPDQTTIHTEFECARMNAVALTDDYFAMPADDPHREGLWREAASETERARVLLERLLGQPDDAAEANTTTARVLVLA